MHGRLLATLALSLPMLAPHAIAQQVVREGAGARRAALDEMERTPFDSQLWGELTSWSGEPVTEATVSGKAVLLVTWAGWYPSAMQALGTAQEMHSKYAGDGLVVVGLHHPQGFDGSLEKASARGVTFPLAHDAEGAVRDALRVDQDPDFYLIDRAGQLRYADIATGSVEEAVKALLAESRQDAASVNERLAEAERAAERAFRQTEQINQQIDLRNLPEVSFDQPTEDDWEWLRENWELRDRDGDRIEVDEFPELQFPEGLVVHPPMPPMAGRLRLVYFWSPDVVSVEQAVLEPMNRLQRQLGRDVVIISVLSPVERRSSRRSEREEAEFKRRLGQVMERMVQGQRLNHSLVFDPDGQLIQQIRDNREISSHFRSSDNLTSLSLLLDSGGTLRWFGSVRAPEFRGSLDQLLRADPGVRNRRRAEAQYIRSRGQ